MIGKAIDFSGAALIGAAFSGLAYAPESGVVTDCDYWRKAHERGTLLNVIGQPLRVAPYHARWWGHEGEYACREVPAIKSQSFHGFIALLVEQTIEERTNAKGL